MSDTPVKPARRLTVAIVLRFFGSTPTILNPERTAYVNDSEGHGIMRPVEIYNENGVGVSQSFGKAPVPTKEAPLVIYLDTNKNRGDGKGVLVDVRVVEQGGPDSPWKLDMTDGTTGNVTPVTYPWTGSSTPAGKNLTCSFSFTGRPKADDYSKELVETGTLGIYREGEDPLRFEVPLKIVYRGPRIEAD